MRSVASLIDRIKRGSVVLCAWFVVGCGGTPEPSAHPIRNVAVGRAVQANQSCSTGSILQRYSVTGRGNFDHYGVDFRVCKGDYIVSIGSGTIDAVFDEPDNSARGGTLLITHRLDWRGLQLYRYEHVAKLRVRQGEHVSRGQILGEAWESADDRSWTPHIHLERVPRNGGDPLPDLAGCPGNIRDDQLSFPVSC